MAFASTRPFRVETGRGRCWQFAQRLFWGVFCWRVTSVSVSLEIAAILTAIGRVRPKPDMPVARSASWPASSVSASEAGRAGCPPADDGSFGPVVDSSARHILAVIQRRRRASSPRPARPPASMSQAEGSGTAFIVTARVSTPM